jgi:polyhydroxyalkanoate synthesis regulator phasin
MVDKSHNSPAQPGSTNPGPAHRPAPGRRGNDMRDTVAELAERAQLISQEAGTKVAAAMKDVISAGAGIAGFAIESARDLVNYMVRRGQMTQEEADILIRDAEAAHDRRPASEKGRPTASKIAAEKAAVAKAEAAARAAAAAAAAPPFRGTRPVVPPAGATNGAKVSPVVHAAPPTKTVASPKPAAAKSSAKPAAKAPAKKAAASKPVAKVPAKAAAKAPAKSAAKSAKAAAKKRKR